MENYLMYYHLVKVVVERNMVNIKTQLLVLAQNFTQAEQRAINYIVSNYGQKYDIVAIARTKAEAIFPYSGENGNDIDFYKCKVECEEVNEENGKLKIKPYVFYVETTSIEEAKRQAFNKGSEINDCNVVSVQKTEIENYIKS